MRLPAAASLLLLLPSAGTGCGSNCKGVGCADEFGAVRVGVHYGARVGSEEEPSPRTPDAVLLGQRVEGTGWTVAIHDGLLWTGMPAASVVRTYRLDRGQSLEAEDVSGSLASDVVGDGFGTVVAPVGDLDGDGVDEVAIAAPGRTTGDLGRESGAVFLVSSDSLAGEQAILDPDTTWRLLGEQSGSRLGEAIAACPDIDGDGLPELLLGAPWTDVDSTEDGEVDRPLAGSAVLVLSESLPSPGRSLQVGASSVLRWTGSHTGARAGSAVACADLIGDLTPDLVITAPFADGDHDAEGAVYVIDGAALTQGDLDATADRVLPGPTENAWLGWSVAVGDLGGDGRVDLLVGAPGQRRTSDDEADRPEGIFVVYDGNDLLDGIHDTPRYRVLGRSPGDSIGRTVHAADVDGDGIDDALVGAPRQEVDNAFDAGALYVFRGDPDQIGWRPQQDTRDADATWAAARQYLETGGSFAVGDIDGDGVLDYALVHRRRPG